MFVGYTFYLFIYLSSVVIFMYSIETRMKNILTGRPEIAKNRFNVPHIKMEHINDIVEFVWCAGMKWNLCGSYVAHNIFLLNMHHRHRTVVLHRKSIVR